jgi:hypothetical protein
MIKLSSLALSFLILVQSLGLGLSNLGQMDELIEHAQFHKEQYGDGILVFLSKHYGELKAEHAQKHQEEKKEHEELPFQQQTQGPSISVFVLSLKTTELLSLDSSSFHKPTFYYQERSFHSHLEGFFHPPRQS